jgi:hypothetical protein
MGNNFTTAATPLLSESLARVVVPENVYAATFLLERIDSLGLSAETRRFLEQAGREIRAGHVSDQTLERLISLQAQH